MIGVSFFAFFLQVIMSSLAALVRALSLCTYLTNVCYSSSSPCNIQDQVVENYPLTYFDSWTRCYFMPYSDFTTVAALVTACGGSSFLALPDVYIFMGAMATAESTVAYVGSYAPADVLYTLTPSKTIAYQSSRDGRMALSGIIMQRTALDLQSADIIIDLVDISNLAVNTRLSWYTIGSWGGYRAGSVYDLHFNTV